MSMAQVPRLLCPLSDLVLPLFLRLSEIAWLYVMIALFTLPRGC